MGCISKVQEMHLTISYIWFVQPLSSLTFRFPSTCCSYFQKVGMHAAIGFAELVEKSAWCHLGGWCSLEPARSEAAVVAATSNAMGKRCRQDMVAAAAVENPKMTVDGDNPVYSSVSCLVFCCWYGWSKAATSNFHGFGYASSSGRCDPSSMA